jgi:predicted acyl esterase
MVKNILLSILLGISLSSFALLNPIVDSIPMSDGKKLAADVYIPAGMTQGPVILVQTPYNRLLYRNNGLPLGVNGNIDSSKYIFVIVDWRGFYGSAAAATLHNPPQGLDGYYCVEWIAQQSWSNGKIGTNGASALGKIQYQTAEFNPPHLTCICPTVAAPLYTYYEYYPNGDLRTEYLQKLTELGYGLQTGVMGNQVYDNTWQYTEASDNYPDSIRVPCYMIGGWYDHNVKDMLTFFPEIVAQSPANVRGKHRLLMGPWAHGGHSIAHVGTANQGQLTYNNAAGWNDSLSLIFYDFYLRGIANGWEQTPIVQYYQMGEDTWQSTSSWPPTGPVVSDFYMHSDGSLNNNLPANSTDSVNYNYDPTDPSPSYGGPLLRSDLAQGPYDQADTVENRHDIAIFTTDTFPQNIVMRGSAVVHLKVSSDRLNTDFDVRFTDVYPDGRSMILDHGPMRMSCRNGVTAADTSAIIPGQVYDATITLPYTCITFTPGHRIRIDVTSSNYPAFNRNMNNDAAQYPNNSLDTLINPLIAANTVYTNSVNTSYVELPLIGYTAPNGIKNISELSGITVYPNPTADQLHIIFSQSTEGMMHLYDATGSLLLSQKITGMNNTLSTAALANGVYMLKVEGGQGMSVKKVVVSR